MTKIEEYRSKSNVIVTNREFLAIFLGCNGAHVELVIEQAKARNNKLWLWYVCSFKNKEEKDSVMSKFYSDEAVIHPQGMEKYQEWIIRQRIQKYKSAKGEVDGK